MNSRQPIICLSSSFHTTFLFSGFMILFTIVTISASFGGNETDHMALLSFKNMITQDPFGALSSWNNSFHFCDWNGVSCGKRHKRVTVVKLEMQGLKGSLSPHVGNLSFLREFWLKNNSFGGNIPHELGRLSRLRLLNLGHNKFTGFIPTNLSGCSNLEDLRLSFNLLVGSIPRKISFLSKLTALSLSKNNLTSGIPPFLGNITSIEIFSITENPLGGSIPHALGNWKNLREFYSGMCSLHGSIAHSIYNHSLLTYFSSAHNQHTGSLLQSIGAMFPHLIGLQLTNNSLTGPLPLFISNCSKLQYLEMNGNKFSGRLTISFSKLRDLNILSLDNNNLYNGEADEMKFIDSLNNCSQLMIMSLDSCNIQGILPKSIGNLSYQLYYLSLGGNKLYGNLPSSIGNLVGLTELNLAYNRFTGKIPSTIGMLQKIQAVSLHRNQFTGPIPDTIGNLSKLIFLNLHSNRLEGYIPSSLGNCQHLSELYLTNNKLTGKIPKQVFQIPSLSISLYLSYNMLFGSLPTEVGELKMLSNLDLSHNKFSGSIPTSLGGCTSLPFLYLNDNLFQGIIPSSLSSLRGVSKLDLSRNNLSGQIPTFFENFSLEYLNLSFNDFVGEVPLLGVFANSSAFSVSGNSRLCGGLVKLGLPKCKETKKHKKRVPLLVICIFIAFTLFTVLCFVHLWCKKKSKSQPSQSFTMNERFLKVSYNQLARATNGFSEANLIGRGGFSFVYKGVLDNDDGFVAIKVLHLQIQGAYRSFDKECEAWRSIRHRNLLKILTSCSSVDFQGNDFKALVYEYMPNESLNDWLHSSTSTHRLDLIQRINILIDVACALDYLHNHCQTTIVHGDLKPSNILLDENMVAHVGDFGLSKFLGTDSNQSNSVKFRGTIGYAPPEYGLGSEMTCSGDVYSFGVLLLEVMIGKKPTDDMFNNGLSLHKFAYMALPDHVMDVIDGDLINYPQDDAIAQQTNTSNAQKTEECMASILNIGVSCSVDSPPQRMNIRDVSNQLQNIMATLQNV